MVFIGIRLTSNLNVNRFELDTIACDLKKNVFVVHVPVSDTCCSCRQKPERSGYYRQNGL